MWLDNLVDNNEMFTEENMAICRKSEFEKEYYPRLLEIVESSERLPQVGERVLGFILNRNRKSGYWDLCYCLGDGWEDASKLFIFSTDQVPLWQPLPTIPDNLIKKYNLLID